jgi:hypothetical protein
VYNTYVPSSELGLSQPLSRQYSAFGLIYDGAIGHQRQMTSLCDPLVVTHISYQHTYDNFLGNYLRRLAFALASTSLYASEEA